MYHKIMECKDKNNFKEKSTISEITCPLGFFKTYPSNGSIISVVSEFNENIKHKHSLNSTGVRNINEKYLIVENDHYSSCNYDKSTLMGYSLYEKIPSSDISMIEELSPEALKNNNGWQCMFKSDIRQSKNCNDCIYNCSNNSFFIPITTGKKYLEIYRDKSDGEKYFTNINLIKLELKKVDPNKITEYDLKIVYDEVLFLREKEVFEKTIHFSDAEKKSNEANEIIVDKKEGPNQIGEWMLTILTLQSLYMKSVNVSCSSYEDVNLSEEKHSKMLNKTKEWIEKQSEDGSFLDLILKSKNPKSEDICRFFVEQYGFIMDKINTNCLKKYRQVIFNNVSKIKNDK